MNLQFDPFRQARRHRQTGQSNRLLRIHRPTGVGQDQIPILINLLQHIGLRILETGQIHPPQSHRHDLRPARLESQPHGRYRGKLTRPDQQPGLKLPISDLPTFRGLKLYAHWITLRYPIQPFQPSSIWN